MINSLIITKITKEGKCPPFHFSGGGTGGMPRGNVQWGECPTFVIPIASSNISECVRVECARNNMLVDSYMFQCQPCSLIPFSHYLPPGLVVWHLLYGQ